MSSHGRRMLKVLLLGDANVGKTSLLNQLVNIEFTSQYSSTPGSDFSTKQMDIDGKLITMVAFGKVWTKKLPTQEILITHWVEANYLFIL